MATKTKIQGFIAASKLRQLADQAEAEGTMVEIEGAGVEVKCLFVSITADGSKVSGYTPPTEEQKAEAEKDGKEAQWKGFFVKAWTKNGSSNGNGRQSSGGKGTKVKTDDLPAPAKR